MVDAFNAELMKKIAHHVRLRRWDAFMHQALIVVAALSGCGTLIAGLYFKDAAAAGMIGVVPSACTLLIQNLHCVRAQNWHDKMATEISAIQRQLQFELDSPTSADVAKLSKQLTALETKMADEWAKATNAYSPSLDLNRRRGS